MTTSSPQPLFYQSSKCVALYLDANKRFQLSLRCPEFQRVHQTATLRVHDLKMRPNDFVVNDTTFTMGVIQKYTNTQTPEFVKVQNASGGIKHDVDRYGLRSNGQEGNQDALILIFLDKQLRQMVADRERRGLDVVSDLDLEAKQLEILSYVMRMTNQEPPFTQYFQLTFSNGTVQNVERVEYNKNLKITRNYILEKIFAGMKVQIGRLQIGGDKFDSLLGRLLRFTAEQVIVPEQQGNAFHGNTLNGQNEKLLPIQDGNLKVSELIVTDESLNNAIAGIKTSLSKTNVSLKKLTCAYQSFPDDPIVQNAEFLCVAGYGTLEVFNERHNNRIHLGECDVMETDFMNLLNKWAMEKSEVGRFYSIGFKQVKKIEELFTLFKNFPGAERGHNEETRLSQFPECIIIPMRDNTELNVWFEETNEEDKEYCDTKYIVKIKVQNSGYALVHGSF
ncbi:hypothetical protein GCK72_004132 [Caenorhabditis remanei]|uniref:Uncharacterized protein n=1 Tax=Caenorhabditis remanei TaxID=31234 RepID=A0A6A5HAG9_CAERE|nr:hypothetical protein GCK72_004132 [Caenorhabditis remanei]KAF1764185.1 hypothetical protein GCK72_004132 [Caenorhabditis remanei]